MLFVLSRALRSIEHASRERAVGSCDVDATLDRDAADRAARGHEFIFDVQSHT